MKNDLLIHFLPTALLDYFEISEVHELGEVRTKKIILEIVLKEKNILPDGCLYSEYESKGFSSTSRIQDFPIRGKAVYLYYWLKIKRTEQIYYLENIQPSKSHSRRIMEFRNIYENNSKVRAKEVFDQWISDTAILGIEEFNTVANSISNNIDNILNFFNFRNTNAFTESFNSKIKLFRANLKSVIDLDFFLFRIVKLYA